MRILITGGAGFIGSHLCDRLLADGHPVIAMDNLITGSTRNIQHLAGPARFPVRQAQRLKLHLRGRPAGRRAALCLAGQPVDYLQLPIQTLKVGALGTHNALGLAKAKGARFLLASTSEVYGDPLEHPQKETYWGHVDPVGPRCVYDEAKRFAEADDDGLPPHHSVDTRIVRIFNTYGPRMRLDDGRVVPNFIGQALRAEPLTVYGDGSQTRCFCYVADLVDGMVRLLLSRRARPGQYRQPQRNHHPRVCPQGQPNLRVTRLASSTRKSAFRATRSSASPTSPAPANCWGGSRAWPWRTACARRLPTSKGVSSAVSLALPHITSTSSRSLWLAALAACFGLIAGLLPLPLAAGILLAAGLLLALAYEPAIGLALTLVVAPVRALVNVTIPGLVVDPGQALFVLTLLAWLAHGVAHRHIVVPRLPLALWLGLGLFLLVGAFSLWNATSLSEGLAEVAKWTQVLLAALLVKDAADRGRARWVLAGLFATAIVQAAAGLWQFGLATYGPDSFIVLGSHYRAYGTFEQPNPFAGFLGMLWPLGTGIALHSWRRSLPRFVLAATAAGLCLAALVASFSRGAWLGAVAAALVMALFLPRRVWLGLSLAAIGGLMVVSAAGAGLLPDAVTARLAGLADFTNIYDVRGVPINNENYPVIQRLAFWQTAEAMGAAHPWLGVGLGNYAAAYPAFALLNWPLAIGHAHNIYLNFLAETGVIGLVSYVALWAVVVALTLSALRSTDGWRRGLALGMLGAWAHLTVHNLVDYLYVNNTHLILGALFGLLAFLVLRPSTSRLPQEPGREAAA